MIIGNPEGEQDEKPHMPSADHIVIALLRRPHDLSDVDYLCGFGRLEHIANFGLPGRGTFMAPKGAKIIKSGALAPKGKCIIGGRNGGGRTLAASSSYISPDNVIKFDVNGSNLTYNMISAWGMAYKEKGEWEQKEFDYELSIWFSYELGGKTYNAEERITSSQAGNPIHRIMPLLIMYGCLAGESKILMADRSCKPIKDIRIGEHIAGKESKIWCVKNVWVGFEERDMVRIKSENGGNLLLTQNHPVMTKSGWKQAGALSTEDVIYAENDLWVEISSISREAYNGEVYNLELSTSVNDDAKSRLMFADGIGVGDNILQNSL